MIVRWWRSPIAIPNRAIQLAKKPGLRCLPSCANALFHGAHQSVQFLVGGLHGRIQKVDSRHLAHAPIIRYRVRTGADFRAGAPQKRLRADFRPPDRHPSRHPTPRVGIATPAAAPVSPATTSARGRRREHRREGLTFADRSQYHCPRRSSVSSTDTLGFAGPGRRSRTCLVLPTPSIRRSRPKHIPATRYAARRGSNSSRFGRFLSSKNPRRHPTLTS